jgi:CHAT domain-containing protein
MRDSAAALPPLHWAWNAAGAPALLVRRWGGVEDRSAALLQRFYEQLRNGTAPSAALQAARASIRAEDGGRAPGAWAGWILVASGPRLNGTPAR